MSRICQEKFQVEYPENHNDEDCCWVSDKSARTKKGIPGREGRSGGDHASKAMNNALFYASTPPGMDIEDQEATDQRVMPFSMGGQTDVSQDWNSTSVREGWSPRKLRPTDDQYTREHNDSFYDEITVDGVTGFIERNNMLDRQ